MTTDHVAPTFTLTASDAIDAPALGEVGLKEARAKATADACAYYLRRTEDGRVIFELRPDGTMTRLVETRAVDKATGALIDRQIRPCTVRLQRSVGGARWYLDVLSTKSPHRPAWERVAKASKLKIPGPYVESVEVSNEAEPALRAALTGQGFEVG